MNIAQKTLLLGLGIIALVVVFLMWKAGIKRPEEVNFAERVSKLQSVGVPDFNLPIIDGFDSGSEPREIRLKSLKSKVILISFWASWCAPCVSEFPSLVMLAKKYGFADLSILAVSIDKDEKDVVSFLRTYSEAGIPNLIVALDKSGEIGQSFGSIKIPETYLVDQEFKLIRKVIDTQDWMSPEFLEFLNSRLGLKPAGS